MFSPASSNPMGLPMSSGVFLLCFIFCILPSWKHYIVLVSALPVLPHAPTPSLTWGLASLSPWHLTGLVNMTVGTLIVCLGLFHVKLAVREEAPSSKTCVDAFHQSHTQSDNRKAWIEISLCQFPFVSLWTS